MKGLIKFEIILIFIMGLAIVLITTNTIQSIVFGFLGVFTIIIISALLTKLYLEHEE